MKRVPSKCGIANQKPVLEAQKELVENFKKITQYRYDAIRECKQTVEDLKLHKRTAKSENKK